MTIAKAVVLKGFKFSADARANMQRVAISAFDQNLARAAGRNGLVHLFDPADYVPATGLCADRAAAASSLGCVGAKYTAGVFSNGKPAIVPAAGNAGLRTTALKAETSFTVLLAYEVTAALEAGNAIYTLFGCNAATRLQAYKQSTNSGNLVMAANGNDLSKGTYNMTGLRHTGIYVDAWSYDATTKTASVVDVSGNVIGATGNAFTLDAANGAAWEFATGLGGANVWDGKFGRILVFDRAMHVAANLPALRETMGLLKADYAL
jgi:hypothetical protein